MQVKCCRSLRKVFAGVWPVNTPLAPLKGGIVVHSPVRDSPLEGGQGGVAKTAKTFFPNTQNFNCISIKHFQIKLISTIY
jgi:hypothetical protein